MFVFVLEQRGDIGNILHSRSEWTQVLIGINPNQKCVAVFEGQFEGFLDREGIFCKRIFLQQIFLWVLGFVFGHIKKTRAFRNRI